ncbi:hypothetical protein V6N13_013066 [Hibiscus sabdariffa]|uniref:Uncharacterized protein n=1 Tax=Hibiscus sabdariffa TaxID=183260 RepID=A0ABR2SGW0_9ROSI
MVVIDTLDVDDGVNHLCPSGSSVQCKEALCSASIDLIRERDWHTKAPTTTSADALEYPPGNDIAIEVLEPQSAETVAEDEILDTSELQSTTMAVVVDEILDTSELQSSIDSMLEMESLDQTYYIRSSDAN